MSWLSFATTGARRIWEGLSSEEGVQETRGEHYEQWLVRVLTRRATRLNSDDWTDDDVYRRRAILEGQLTLGRDVYHELGVTGNAFARTFDPWL